MILKSSRQTSEHKLAVTRFSLLHFTKNTKPGRAKYAGFLAVIVSLISLVSAGIDPGTVKANGLPVIQKSGTLLTSETWAAGNVYMLNGVVTVPNGITLTIDAGAIIKYSSPNWMDRSITVATGGTLDANGTGSNPIIFTSYKDDSAGGDSNGNGTSSGVSGDYLSAITGNGGAISIEHALVRFANSPLTASGSSVVTVDDTQFTTNGAGVFLSGALLQATLRRNTFDVSNTAITASGLSDVTGIALAGTDKNTFSGSVNGTTVLVRSGSKVPTGSTWTVSGGTTGALLRVENMVIDGTVNLEDASKIVINHGWPRSLAVNGILNVGSGTILKYVGAGGSTPGEGIGVATGGTLTVAGTPQSPVVFTSYKDDNAGGDTNGNGASSGALNDFAYAITATGGTVNVDFGQFRFAGAAITASNTAVVNVDDSEFTTGLGLNLSGVSVQATLRRNNFAVANLAISGNLLDISNITLSGADKNIFSGSVAARSVQIRNAFVPSGVTWSVSGTSGALLKTSNVVINGTVNLQDDTLLLVGYQGNTAGITVNGTLNAEAGTIFKYALQDSGTPSKGVTVVPGGVFNSNGTSINPVVFTSFKDDAAGGDTNGNGASSGAPNDYWQAVTGTGGTINMHHGVVRYGGFGIEAGNASVVLAEDSSFADNLRGIELSGSTTQATLYRNSFSANANGALAATALGNITGIVLSGINKNSFSGSLNATTVQIRNTTVPVGTTWTVSSDETGTVLKTSNTTVNGTLTLRGNTLFLVGYPGNTAGVTVNGTLNAEEGTIFKYALQDGGTPSQGVRVLSGGVFNATGTFQYPVIFTSYKDDSAGGDTNGNGASAGVVNDYWYALTGNGGAVNLQHSIIRFAGGAIDTTSTDITASDVALNNINLGAKTNGGNANFANTTIANATKGLMVNGGAQVTYRGSFANITNRSIEACNWDMTCAVDAAYVDWGTADGPFPAGANPKICGHIAFSPWVHSGSTYDGELFASFNCDGSTTPVAAMNSSITSFQQAVSPLQIDCSNGFQDACDAIESAMACLGGSMTAAQSTSPWPLPPATTSQEVAAFGQLAGSSASTYITSQTSVSVSGFNFALLGQLAGVVDTFSALNSAYSSCAP